MRRPQLLRPVLLWPALLPAALLFSATCTPVYSQRSAEGPRHAAKLLHHAAEARFVLATKSAQAQRFFDQGLTLLHCGQAIEAERSFRTAALHDPASAMPYLGMILANAAKPDHAQTFAWEAYRRREACNPLAAALIEAYAQHWSATQEPPKSVLQAVRSLRSSGRKAPADTSRLLGRYRKLVAQHPEHLELRALWSHELWRAHKRSASSALAQTLRAQVDAIVARDAQHPAWRYLALAPLPRATLARAAKHCGPAAASFGSMWRASSHAYRDAGLLQDAARAAETALRVDHARMQKSGLLPFDIPDYAASGVAYCRALLATDRTRAALSFAQRLHALPRHPHLGDAQGKLIQRCLEACRARAKAREDDAHSAPEPASSSDQSAFGPLAWTPPKAPDFKLPRGRGGSMSLAELRGKPTLLVFFLGFG